MFSRHPKFRSEAGANLLWPPFLFGKTWVGVHRLKICQKRTSLMFIRDWNRWIRGLGKCKVQKKIVAAEFVFARFINEDGMFFQMLRIIQTNLRRQ